MRAFLRDMEKFNNYLSRRFGLSVRAVDQKVALAVERQRLREANEDLPTKEEVQLRVEGPRREPQRPRRRLSGDELDQLLEELDY